MINLPNEFMQAVNGILAVVYMVLLGILIRYLYSKWRVFRWRIKNYEETAMAIGMVAMALGMIMFRAPIWVLRFGHHSSLYDATSVRPWAILMIASGTVCSIVGGLCMIRVLACPSVGEWLWVATFVIAVGFGVITAL